MFTRTTNYGDIHSIGLTIGQTAALAALRRPLEGVEGTNEIFDGATSLEDVVERIESRKLQADK